MKERSGFVIVQRTVGFRPEKRGWRRRGKKDSAPKKAGARVSGSAPKKAGARVPGTMKIPPSSTRRTGALVERLPRASVVWEQAAVNEGAEVDEPPDAEAACIAVSVSGRGKA